MLKILKNNQSLQATFLGLLAIICFSLTLPVTRIAVQELHPFFISSGRSVVASFLAMIYLFFSGGFAAHKIPNRQQFKKIAFVAIGVVLGFPSLISFAMQTGRASHGGVILAILPLATTCCAFLFAKERPSTKFWLYAILGSGLVFVFALSKTNGLRYSDLYLLFAVILAAMAYAIGAVLSKELGGLTVIAWALIISLPILLPIANIYQPQTFSNVHWQTWASFLYMAIFSQFLGFWPWYKALGMGGVAKIGQLQLLQPFFTIFAAFLILDEPIHFYTIAFVCLIVWVVTLSKRA